MHRGLSPPADPIPPKGSDCSEMLKNSEESTKRPQIINIHHGRKPGLNVLFIGRPKTGGKRHFGNPFTHLKGPTLACCQVGSRDESVDAYRDWINGTKFQEVEPERRQWILDNLDQVRNADAVACFCAPLRCHGETLVELAFRDQKPPSPAPSKEPGPDIEDL